MRKSIIYGLSGYSRFTGRENRTIIIIIDFSKDFDLVPRDRLLTKIAATLVVMKVNV
jgi:hypothetical protein